MGKMKKKKNLSPDKDITATPYMRVEVSDGRSNTLSYTYDRSGRGKKKSSASLSNEPGNRSS